MTKKRLAAVLLGVGYACSPAQAQGQGPVIYGALDVGVGTVSDVAGKGRVTGVHNGGMKSSRLGFRGSEDIGGGTTINYLLEADVLVDTGSTGGGTTRRSVGPWATKQTSPPFAVRSSEASTK